MRSCSLAGTLGLGKLIYLYDANDVTLDSARDALSLKNVTLAMESTKALELKLSGNILDYSTKRRMENVAGTIGYDWAKLWEIVRPMMSKEQQENLKLLHEAAAGPDGGARLLALVAELTAAGVDPDTALRATLRGLAERVGPRNGPA